jgi:hypothetical protein
MKLQGISTFHRTVAVFKAAADAAFDIKGKCQFAWHYVELADSFVKIEKGVKFDPNGSKFRGAIAWALRAPGRQVTLMSNGDVRFD